MFTGVLYTADVFMGLFLKQNVTLEYTLTYVCQEFQLFTHIRLKLYKYYTQRIIFPGQCEYFSLTSRILKLFSITLPSS